MTHRGPVPSWLPGDGVLLEGEIAKKETGGEFVAVVLGLGFAMCQNPSKCMLSLKALHDVNHTSVEL